jgi:hypothetical protein
MDELVWLSIIVGVEAEKVHFRPCSLLKTSYSQKINHHVQ